MLEALTLVERTSGDHVSVICEPGTDLPQVAIGAEGTERILLNLVGNARDAIGGRGTVAVRTCRVPIPPGDPALGTGWYALLSVSDDGGGMTTELAARALEPYYTTKAGARGSGLGLPTAAGIARDASGDLRISSAPGIGTTVSVYMPGVRRNGGPLAMPARSRLRFN